MLVDLHSPSTDDLSYLYDTETLAIKTVKRSDMPVVYGMEHLVRLDNPDFLLVQHKSVKKNIGNIIASPWMRGMKYCIKCQFGYEKLSISINGKGVINNDAVNVFGCVFLVTASDLANNRITCWCTGNMPFTVCLRDGIKCSRSSALKELLLS